MRFLRSLLGTDNRRRRLALAAVVYVISTAVYFGFASRQVLSGHTPWNHFALLAHGWLEGRLDLGGAPPGYAGNNDFAEYKGRWFVAFPPFPAVLLLPLVKFAGSPERVRDGQFFLWLAGLGPALLFLGLEKLRRSERGRSARANLLLALLFAFGTVYFFTAEQGTVWFAAHVVAVALAAAYLLFALDAERPLLAGLMLSLAYLTRTPLLFAFPLFLLEALRVCLRPAPEPGLAAGARSPGRLVSLWRRLDRRRFVLLCLAFGLPVVLAVGVAAWHNWARFGSPFEVGYRFLQIAWRGRVEKWGLFDYHYLARNLGVVFTSLPWYAPDQVPRLQINAHGLALWLTTPAYLWLLWPRRTEAPHLALWLTVLAVAIPTLFYQNTGWLQFGYRFSNDYAVFLFALLATGGFRFGTLFFLAGVWAVAINGFGALTFGRPQYGRYYHQEATQRVIYQPD
jgi:hypothetical protein